MYRVYCALSCACTLAGIGAALMCLLSPSVGAAAGFIYFSGLYACAWLLLGLAERSNKHAIKRPA